jgi:hypothetical protein
MRFVFLLLAAAAGLAQPATAQPLQTAGRTGAIAGACGQPQALTYSLPGPLDQTPMAPLSVQIERAEPVYLEFTLTGESRVALRTEVDDGSDPYLALFSAGGGLIAQDDDTAGNLNALIDSTLAPGTYCAQLRMYGGASDALPRITLNAATGEAAEALAVVPPDPGEADAAVNCTDPALTADLGTALAPGFGRLERSSEVPQGLRSDLRISVAEATLFQADTTNSAFDTVVTLTDAGGNVVATNDDGPNMGTDSRVAVELQPGDYCLSVRDYAGGGGATTLVMSDTPDAPVAGDISTACTNPELTQPFGAALAQGVGRSVMSGMLDAGSRRDWQIEVAEAGTYQFDLGSEAFDSYLTLLDASGIVLQVNDDREGSIDSRIVADLAPGSYCLAVEALGGGVGGAFQVSASDQIDDSTSSPFAVPACSAPDLTAPLGVDPAPGFGTHSVEGEIAPNSRRDWAFSVAQGASVRFEARSQALDTILTVYDASGAVVGQNDDGPSGTDSLLSLPLAAGDYCVTVEGFIGAGGPIELIVAEVGAAVSDNPTPETGEVVPGPDSGVAIEDLGQLDDMLQSNAPSEEATKWLAFTMAEAGEVTVNGVSAGSGFVLRLFAEDGTRLGAAEGLAGLTPAKLDASLQPGRYLVAMTLPAESDSRLRNVVITRN